MQYMNIPHSQLLYCLSPAYMAWSFWAWGALQIGCLFLDQKYGKKCDA